MKKPLTPSFGLEETRLIFISKRLPHSELSLSISAGIVIEASLPTLICSLHFPTMSATASTTPIPEPGNSASSGSGGLSGGDIAGIVVGVVSAVLTAIGLVISFCTWKYPASPAGQLGSSIKRRLVKGGDAYGGNAQGKVAHGGNAQGGNVESGGLMDQNDGQDAARDTSYLGGEARGGDAHGEESAYGGNAMGGSVTAM